MERMLNIRLSMYLPSSKRDFEKFRLFQLKAMRQSRLQYAEKLPIVDMIPEIFFLILIQNSYSNVTPNHATITEFAPHR